MMMMMCRFFGVKVFDSHSAWEAHVFGDTEPAGQAGESERESEDDLFVLMFEDPDRKTEVFAGYGARDAANRRYEQAKVSWNCVLLAPIARSPEPTPPAAEGDARLIRRRLRFIRPLHNRECDCYECIGYRESLAAFERIVAAKERAEKRLSEPLVDGNHSLQSLGHLVGVNMHGVPLEAAREHLAKTADWIANLIEQQDEWARGVASLGQARKREADRADQAEATLARVRELERYEIDGGDGWVEHSEHGCWIKYDDLRQALDGEGEG